MQCMHSCIYTHVFISADPGLGEGRGGAWDHRRCGTSLSSLSTAKPILQPSSHINSFCRLPALKPSKLHPAANRHPAPQINRFLWRLLHPTATPRPHINGFLWASKATHQWLLMGIQVCRFILQPTATPRHTSMASCGHSCSETGTPGPHINGFLWASTSAVCQP